MTPESELRDILKKHGADDGEFQFALMQDILDHQQIAVIEARIEQVESVYTSSKYGEDRTAWDVQERLELVKARLQSQLKELKEVV